MAFVLGLNTRELATTTGSPLVMALLGPIAGNQSFIASIGNGNTTIYRLENGDAWEQGVCLITAGTPNTLTREANPRFGSSNAGAAIAIDGTIDIKIWSALPQDILALLDLLMNGTFQLKNYVGTRTGSYADFSLRNARGTPAAPLYLLADNNVGGVTFYGWSEAVNDWVPAASILVQAAENWGANARGSRVVISSHLLGGLGEEWRLGYSTEFDITDAGKTATINTFNVNSTIIGTAGNTSGKFYVEFIPHINGGSYNVYGLAKATQANNVLVGNDTNGIGLYRRGDIANAVWLLNGAQTDTGMAKPTDGQVIGMAFDLTAGKAWVRNVTVDPAVWYGHNSGSPDPVSGTDGFAFTPFAAAMFLGFTSASNGVAQGATIVSGALGFNADAPTGFNPWSASAGMVDGLAFWEDGGLSYGGLPSMGLGTLNTEGYFKKGVALITGSDVSGHLPSISSGHLLGNATGSAAVAADTSLTGLIDQALGNTRGAVLYRGSTGWVILSPGTSGQFLETLGAGADPAWATVAGGTPTIAAATLLANATGSPAAAAETSLTAIIDAAIGNTRGAVLYRGAAGWALRTPGTSGFALVSAGAGADPDWASVSGSLPTIAQGHLLGWTSAGSGAAVDVALTALIDAAIGNTRGGILYRGASGWALRSPGTSGFPLASAGSGADPDYTAPKYVIASFSPGVLINSQNLLYHKFSKAITIPANFGSYQGHTSEAGGTANTTASTVININKAVAASPNSFSNVGTITFASGTITPTFASSGGASISFAQGDVLRIQGPSTADVTFAGFYATLVGFET